ncbi:hypothetical protein ACFFSY_01450 [Paenibacillus aurantiacus]|uniref:Nuclear transport factor 2 family protein n=1 Tax=Paenibacillus aurantiacus TaxID=1936118 RepID=A0ABV5KH91_9BACL
MKKPFLMMLIFTLSSMLTGCNFIEEQKAEGIINHYYRAISDGDYEKAFEQLQLYDYDARTGEGHYTEGTTLSHDEAKAHYLKKITTLKEQNYKLIGYEIIKVEYEDGHSFWHHIKLEVEQNGQKFEWNEVAEIYKGKLVIGEKDDPYAKYRDGKMHVENDFNRRKTAG